MFEVCQTVLPAESAGLPGHLTGPEITCQPASKDKGLTRFIDPMKFSDKHNGLLAENPLPCESFR